MHEIEEEVWPAAEDDIVGYLGTLNRRKHALRCYPAMNKLESRRVIGPDQDWGENFHKNCYICWIMNSKDVKIDRSSFHTVFFFVIFFLLKPKHPRIWIYRFSLESRIIYVLSSESFIYICNHAMLSPPRWPKMKETKHCMWNIKEGGEGEFTEKYYRLFFITMIDYRRAITTSRHFSTI